MEPITLCIVYIGAVLEPVQVWYTQLLAGHATVKANKVMEKADEKVLVRVRISIISTWPSPAKLIMTRMKIFYARAIEFTASREVCIVKKHYLDNLPTKTGFHYLSQSIFSYLYPIENHKQGLEDGELSEGS